MFAVNLSVAVKDCCIFLHRSCTSEYSYNFQPPWKFEVKEGTWKGASPPHVGSGTVRTSVIVGHYLKHLCR